MGVNLYNDIKKLKIEAMKNKDTNAIEAYDTVLANIELAKSNKNFKFTEADVFAIIKKEISIFNESMSSDENILEGYKVKANILNELLPKQLSNFEILELLDSYEGDLLPAPFMKYLDEKGYVGQYDRRLVAGLVMNRKA